MRDSRYQGRIIGGLLLIAFGLLFMLNNFDILDFVLPDFVFTWQFFFIGFGLILFFAARNKVAGLIFICIGLFNLYPELWPLIFVLIGAYIIIKRRNDHYLYKRHYAGFGKGEDYENYIDDVSVFGGGTKVHNISNFKGGQVTSIFGGSEINLQNCSLADGDNLLEISSIFGGSSLIVPKNWDISIDVVPIFGGFGDKRIRDPNIEYLPGKRLIIKGSVIFGGGELKNYK